MTVAALIEQDGRYLLVEERTAAGLRLNTPAGHLEPGESPQDGAAREALEEANARVQIGDLYTFYSLPHISQLYVFFRSRLTDLDFSPGEESLEVKLFTEREIPWDELAFASVNRTLEHYFADRKAGRFIARAGDIRPPER